MRTDISLSAEKAFEVFKVLCEAGEPCNLASLVQVSMAIYFDPPLANKIDPPFIV